MREQNPRGQVEHDQRAVGRKPGTPPQQRRNDCQVEQGAAPAHGVGNPQFLKQRAEQRQVAVLVEPDAHGQGVQQPVRVELGDAGEDVHDADLGTQNPNGPGRHAVAVQRQNGQQQADQAHQVVVVEVRSSVDQLNVGEADAEQRRADSRTAAGGDAQADQAQSDKVDVHSPAGPRLHPAEAQVGEVMGRINVERADPAVGEKADDDGQPQQSENHSKRYGGRRIDTAIHLCPDGAAAPRSAGPRHSLFGEVVVHPATVDRFVHRNVSIRRADVAAAQSAVGSHSENPPI